MEPFLRELEDQQAHIPGGTETGTRSTHPRWRSPRLHGMGPRATCLRRQSKAKGGDTQREKVADCYYKMTEWPKTNPAIPTARESAIENFSPI